MAQISVALTVDSRDTSGVTQRVRGDEWMTLAARHASHADRLIDAFLDSSIAKAAEHGADYVQLWKTIRSGFGGGKRLRPRLVTTAYAALGGSDGEVVAQVAAAFEVLHTAFLLHDDVIDRDFVRRGELNVAGHYLDQALASGRIEAAAQHHAYSMGLLAGDLLLSGAHALVGRTLVDSATRQRLSGLIDQAVFASVAGELVDVGLAVNAQRVSVDDVIEMEYLKTAVYSFEAPLQAGAVLAGAEPETISRLATVGKGLGIAYQIVDDVLGVLGDPAVTGKSNLGDLREGKRTVLISYAQTTSHWPEIRDGLGQHDLSQDEAEKIRRALIDCGAVAFAENLAQRHAATARDVLRDPGVPTALGDALDPFVGSILDRRR